jgi:hypothetical protein
LGQQLLQPEHVAVGTVTVSLAKGGKGADGSKRKEVRVGWLQVPATAGVSVGATVSTANEEEKARVMALSDATPVAPLAGVVVTRRRAAAGVLVVDPVRWSEARDGGAA